MPRPKPAKRQPVPLRKALPPEVPSVTTDQPAPAAASEPAEDPVEEAVRRMVEAAYT